MGFGYNDFDTGFGMEFQLFNVMFFLIFFLILGMFLFMIVKGLSTWNKNNQSPRLTVDATVVAKPHHHNGDNMATHSTWYYATFQVESGDRMEFAVDGMEYGMLAEGDMGKLSFQGTRYLSFQRER